MSKGLKILLGVMIFLAVLSAIFLLTSKKKPASAVTQTQKTATAANAKPNKVATPSGPSTQTFPQTNPAQAPQQVAVDHKALIRSQWTQCKNKTMQQNTNLFWNVQIFEAIPQGGTYAKGNLDSDSAYSVHVIIKSDSQIKDKINQMLQVGKMAFVRGNCTDVATDGSVVLQAF
ncbi:MAG TPA: hypothetical protein VF817_03355 [Patescibacteria group bacterium]